jgi:NTP pyrophosphatase (non-canonical NTP hydrolase)
MGFGTNGLSFNTLRGASIRRQQHPKYANCAQWDHSKWLQALVGEVGEFANDAKKFDRGDLTEAEFREKATKELADVVTYVDSLAAYLGIDLGRAVVDKFNEVSERIGSNVVMAYNDDWHIKAEPEE